jgi:hypothetical protein
MQRTLSEEPEKDGRIASGDDCGTLGDQRISHSQWNSRKRNRDFLVTMLT